MQLWNVYIAEKEIPFVGRVSRTNREKVALFILGVDQEKETLLSRLKLDFEGEGYCHFPMEGDRGYDEAKIQNLLNCFEK